MLVHYAKRNRKKTIAGLLFWVVVIVGLIERGNIYILFTATIPKAFIAFWDTLPTSLGANYLLVILIVVTAGGYFVNSLINWVRRPQPSLRRFEYESTKLKMGYPLTGQVTHERGIYLVFLDLWNSGYESIRDPVVEMVVTDQKLGLVNPDLYVCNLNKFVSLIESKTWWEVLPDDDLAIEFLKTGLSVVDAVPSKQEGRQVLIGFAFEKGSQFYIATELAIRLRKVELGEEKKKYLSFIARGSNRQKKIMERNALLELPAWDKIKCRSWWEQD